MYAYSTARSTRPVSFPYSDASLLMFILTAVRISVRILCVLISQSEVLRTQCAYLSNGLVFIWYLQTSKKN